jgi:hypothetical protein
MADLGYRIAVDLRERIEAALRDTKQAVAPGNAKQLKYPTRRHSPGPDGGAVHADRRGPPGHRFQAVEKRGCPVGGDCRQARG